LPLSSQPNEDFAPFNLVLELVKGARRWSGFDRAVNGEIAIVARAEEGLLALLPPDSATCVGANVGQNLDLPIAHHLGWVVKAVYYSPLAIRYSLPFSA
jgi:hypothetical protein